MKNSVWYPFDFLPIFLSCFEHLLYLHTLSISLQFIFINSYHRKWYHLDFRIFALYTNKKWIPGPPKKKKKNGSKFYFIVKFCINESLWNFNIIFYCLFQRIPEIFIVIFLYSNIIKYSKRANFALFMDIRWLIWVLRLSPVSS